MQVDIETTRRLTDILIPACGASPVLARIRYSLRALAEDRCWIRIRIYAFALGFSTFIGQVAISSGLGSDLGWSEETSAQTIPVEGRNEIMIGCCRIIREAMQTY